MIKTHNSLDTRFVRSENVRKNELTNVRVNAVDPKTFRLLCRSRRLLFFFTYLLFMFFFIFRSHCRFHATCAFRIQKRNRVRAYDFRRNAYDADGNKIRRRRPSDPDRFSFRVFESCDANGHQYQGRREAPCKTSLIYLINL